MVAMSTSAWLMREGKIPLGPCAIQYLATTLPPVCVMVKEQEGNEVMAIFKEFFEHGYMPCCLKSKKSFVIIIAILQSNPEYDYFIQKRSWQGTDMKIRAIQNS